MEGVQEVRMLDRGTFGEAWLVTKDGTNLVLKKVSLEGMPANGVAYQLQEISLLRNLDHPNIVSYKGADMVGRTLYLLMEYCERGDLGKVISERGNNNNYFPEASIRAWARQLAIALQYLHGNRVLHRDLKPKNVFLTSGGDLKLGDFGLARVLSTDSNMAATVLGTRAYMAPEVVNGTPYDSKADMFAMGGCIYEMSSLKHAFPYVNLNVPAQYSRDLKRLIRELLSQDPAHRPSASEVLSHPALAAAPNTPASALALAPATLVGAQASPTSGLITTSTTFHNPDKILVVVRDLDGSKITLRINPSRTVLEVKRKLQARSGVDPANVSLVFQGLTLQDDATLASYGVTEGNNLQLLHRHLGGGRGGGEADC